MPMKTDCKTYLFINVSCITLTQETLLWSMKKQRWFRGPNLPTDIANGSSMKCATAVNFSTAYIFQSFTYETSSFSFDFHSKIWTKHKDPPYGFLGFLSCTLYLTKKYKRLLYNDFDLHYCYCLLISVHYKLGKSFLWWVFIMDRYLSIGYSFLMWMMTLGG